MNEVIIDELNSVNEDSTKTSLAPNQEIVSRIVEESRLFVLENPEYHFSYILYSLSKSVLYHSKLRSDVGNITHTLFAYYINAYQLYVCLVNNDNRNESVINNEAALVLFDLYVDYPKDSSLRQLVALAGEALREVIIARHCEDKSIDIKDMMGYLSNLAMMTSTIKSYTKSSKAVRNVPYIKWLREFLYHAINVSYLKGLFVGISSGTLSNTDVEFVQNSPDVLKIIIPQITNRKSVIKLN